MSTKKNQFALLISGASQLCKFIELGALNFQIPGILEMPGILYGKC
ncbi:hypothetical protein CKA32_004119 [Geitlerinema sp. FC II]|nr:hypothetical protein CKA32_004119 [Geitlerinema sp. FC II]